MELKRYALFVDVQDGQSHQLVHLLKELGLRSLPVTSLAQAIDMITKSPGLVAVVISDSIGPLGSSALATAVRNLYPQLPIIWVSSLRVPPDVGAGPFVSIPGVFEAETYRPQLTRMLRDPPYPPEIIDALQASVASVLRDSYRMAIVKQEAYLRFSRELLANVSALISFSGSGVTGRLVVGGTAEWFQTLLSQSHRKQLDAELDVAGELGNRVLGRFKEFFEVRGIAVNQVAPVLVLGRGTHLREQDGVSVAIRCSLNAQDSSVLFVDLVLKGLLGDIAKRPATTPVQSTGSVEFL